MTITLRATKNAALTQAELDGNFIDLASRASAVTGLVTLTSGTVTVNSTAVTATSVILLTPQNGSTTGALRISARVVGVSFTITSSDGSDARSIGYAIFAPFP